MTLKPLKLNRAASGVDVSRLKALVTHLFNWIDLEKCREFAHALEKPRDVFYH